MENPIRINAEDVYLREFESSDVDSVLAIIGDDRVTQWLSFDSRDRAGAERMIAATMEARADAPRKEYYFAVAHQKSDELLGFVRLGLGGTRAAKLGYAIHADHWGNGFASQAARAVTNFGFATLDLHRITAAVGPSNYASQAILQRLGFQREGTLRDHVHTNGAWRDSVLYSILTTDWKQAN